jgi:sigma-B regulation protein RsbU (phosphoserine phosphatase)
MESKILVVDDNPVNRKLLTTILGREGYQSLEAENGEDALRIARSEDPDVILLDIMMPGQDGFSVCQELRQDPLFEDTPVLFLSALSEVKERIKGFDVGANDYITKPYHQSEVLARVKRSISIRRKNQRQKRRFSAIEESERVLRESHDNASELQRSMLPGKTAGADLLETAWWHKAPGGISGEMFNVMRLEDRSFGIFLFDAGGRGLAAAATALTLMKVLASKPGGLLRPRSAAGLGYQAAMPDKVLGSLDRSIGLQGIDTFFCMQYMLFDAATGILNYANVGGKPFPLLLRFDGTTEWLEGKRPSADGREDFFQGTVTLKKGDRVFLMSDGVTFYGAAQGKPFSSSRVEALLVATRARDLADSIASIEAALEAFSEDSEPRSMLAFEYLGAK